MQISRKLLLTESELERAEQRAQLAEQYAHCPHSSTRLRGTYYPPDPLSRPPPPPAPFAALSSPLLTCPARALDALLGFDLRCAGGLPAGLCLYALVLDVYMCWVGLRRVGLGARALPPSLPPLSPSSPSPPPTTPAPAPAAVRCAVRVPCVAVAVACACRRKSKELAASMGTLTQTLRGMELNEAKVTHCLVVHMHASLCSGSASGDVDVTRGLEMWILIWM